MCRVVLLVDTCCVKSTKTAIRGRQYLVVRDGGVTWPNFFSLSKKSFYSERHDLFLETGGELMSPLAEG